MHKHWCEGAASLSVILMKMAYSVCHAQEKEIVKIQAYLKANKARVDYRTLSKSITLYLYIN